MKFQIEEVAEYKKIVNTLCGLASKKLVSSLEQCVMIETYNDNVILTAMESGSHYLSYSIKAMVLERGKALILSAPLKSITNKLQPKTVVTVSSNQNLFTYQIKPYGTINENLYFDQTSLPVDFNLNSFTCLSSNEDILKHILPLAASVSYDNKSVLFKTSVEKFEIYAQLSEIGFIKYVAPNPIFQQLPAQIYIKPSLVNKTISSLGNSLSIYFKDNKLVFDGEVGTLSIEGERITNNYSVTTEEILSQPVTGKIVVNHEDLVKSVDFQSYNVDNRQSIDLKTENGNLLVQCSRYNEPAQIIGESQLDFQPMTLSLSSFTTALKAIGKDKSKILPITKVLLQQRTLPVGEGMKVLSLSPVEEPDCFAIAIIFESRIVNR